MHGDVGRNQEMNSEKIRVRTLTPAQQWWQRSKNGTSRVVYVSSSNWFHRCSLVITRIPVLLQNTQQHHSSFLTHSQDRNFSSKLIARKEMNYVEKCHQITNDLGYKTSNLLKTVPKSTTTETISYCTGASKSGICTPVWERVWERCGTCRKPNHHESTQRLDPESYCNRAVVEKQTVTTIKTQKRDSVDQSVRKGTKRPPQFFKTGVSFNFENGVRIANCLRTTSRNANVCYPISKIEDSGVSILTFRHNDVCEVGIHQKHRKSNWRQVWKECTRILVTGSGDCRKPFWLNSTKWYLYTNGGQILRAVR